MLLVIEGTQFGYLRHTVCYWISGVGIYVIWGNYRLSRVTPIVSENKQKHAGGVKMMLAKTLMTMMMMIIRRMMKMVMLMMMMMIPEFPLWARIWLEPGPPWPRTAMKTCKTATKNHCKKIGIIKQGTLYKIRVWRMFRSHLKLKLGSLGHTNALRPLSDWGTCSTWSS